MIKLTALYYKLKTESLERFHNITEYSEKLLNDWEKELEKSKDLDTEYPYKPFIEPFEFEEEDYDITEQKFRINSDKIILYKENLEGYSEVVISDTLSFIVKESVEEIDKKLGV